MILQKLKWRPQHSLSHDLEDIQLDYVLKHAGLEDNITLQARLRSMSAKYAGGWLRVIPSKSLSLDFKSQGFLIVSEWWMGIPLVPTGQMFECNKCGTIIDASGYHALTCKSGGGLDTPAQRNKRHYWKSMPNGRLEPKARKKRYNIKYK